MDRSLPRPVVSGTNSGRLVAIAMVAVLLVWPVTKAHGGITTLFWDDFEAQTVGTDPGMPRFGQPWGVSKVALDGLQVAIDPRAPAGANQVLQFGSYRNTARLSFSSENQDLVRTNKNLTLKFQYYGYSLGGYVSTFDVSALDNNSGVPAFLVRIMPQPSLGSNVLHDVYYLDPGGGLLDSGLNIASDSYQNMTIISDFVSRTCQLDIDGNVATLPLFVCPSMIGGAQFSSYLLGTGAAININDVTATTHAPEPTTICLVFAGLLCFLAYARKLRRHGK